MNVIADIKSVDWPKEELVAAARITSGSPATSTLPLHSDERVQFGLWYATPGAFTTDHAGYEEFIQVLDGTGSLIHEDGTATPLGPGTIVHLEDGWRGSWVIEQTLIKSYTTVVIP